MHTLENFIKKPLFFKDSQFIFYIIDREEDFLSIMIFVRKGGYIVEKIICTYSDRCVDGVHVPIGLYRRESHESWK